MQDLEEYILNLQYPLLLNTQKQQQMHSIKNNSFYRYIFRKNCNDDHSHVHISGNASNGQLKDNDKVDNFDTYIFILPALTPHPQREYQDQEQINK
jgi:hypothetical protein